jgi:serine/threonine-protein kinase RsbW
MVVYPARIDSLGRITNQVVQEAKAAGLSERAIYDVEVAIDEACVNIIEHSYGGEDKGEIECECQILPDGLKIVLHDTGCFFNPDDIPEPDLNSPLEERKTGGLGLYFMRKLMDEVSFDPCMGEGTTLTMIKRKG